TRRNVVISGVDLNSLIGKEFELQGVHFEGSCECSPCFWMDEAIAPGAEEFLKGQGGLRARVLTDGILKVDPLL
ncbi:MAG: molybdenum cofactor biosysynthesis protein, partial [Verrucomicrobiota bacterium]